MGICTPHGKGSRLVRKQKHPAPRLDDIDPDFGVDFDEDKHGNMLRSQLNIAHLSADCQADLTALIKKYWRVFFS